MTVQVPPSATGSNELLLNDVANLAAKTKKGETLSLSQSNTV